MAIFTVNRALEAVFLGDGGNDTINANLFADENYDDGITVLADLAGGAGDDSIGLVTESYEATVRATISGGEGSDTINVDIHSESISPDVALGLDGGDGEDLISVRIVNMSSGIEVPTVSSVRGGDGNDTISVELYQGPGTTNYVYGGDGDDTITALVSSLTDEGFALGNDVDGGDGNDTMTLTANSGGMGANPFNDASGGEGNDLITATVNLAPFDLGATATNVLRGDAGDDSLTATITVDSVDDLSEGSFYSELYGGSGNDRLKVSGGDGNVIFGNGGADTLLGSGNDDYLIGGVGADLLRGNGGVDTFEFWGARGLSAAERDRIVDFEIGEDLIDVSRIDANAFRSGNQAFRFNSNPDDWQGTGRLWVENNPDNEGSIVYASTGSKMFAVNLLDGASVDASDYSASNFIL